MFRAGSMSVDVYSSFNTAPAVGSSGGEKQCSITESFLLMEGRRFNSYFCLLP